MKRLFLEISSGQGPEECELLVAKLMVRLTSELRREVRFREVALNGNREKSLVKSVLFELEGEGAAVSVAPWLGTIQWIAASRFRPARPGGMAGAPGAGTRQSGPGVPGR